jgi:hypothetical protein
VERAVRATESAKIRRKASSTAKKNLAQPAAEQELKNDSPRAPAAKLATNSVAEKLLKNPSKNKKPIIGVRGNSGLTLSERRQRRTIVQKFGSNVYLFRGEHRK